MTGLSEPGRVASLLVLKRGPVNDAPRRTVLRSDVVVQVRFGLVPSVADWATMLLRSKKPSLSWAPWFCIVEL